MRKFRFLMLALCLAVFFPTTAEPAEVCEISTDTLEVAGEVSFTSSFCDCMDGETITIDIMPADPTVVIDSVVFTKATPHWQFNQSWAEQAGLTSYTADVTLHKWTEMTHTVHLWVYLSTGEHIGVNAHF